MNNSMWRIFGIIGLFLLGVLIIQCASENSDSDQQQSDPNTVQKAAEDVPELADAMGQLQTFLHKFALAVEAENHELASFYFHEVEASAEHIKENIPSYEGYEIPRFMRLFLDPTIEPVESALDERNWEEVRKQTETMVSSGCNSCHNATNHGFIEVTPGYDNNPFNQNFSGSE